MRRIILASRSKRRSAILAGCHIPHITAPSDIKETYDPRNRAGAAVLRNAKRKAETVAAKFRQGIIVGVDTLVLFKGRLVGKPRTKNEARRMLAAFSGSRMAVYSGICLIDTGSRKSALGFEKTSLRVKKIPRRDIEKYFRRLGPYDKAGGFSIEGVGSLVFDDIDGSYFNVLGLPMGKLQELFQELGLDLLDFVR